MTEKQYFRNTDETSNFIRSSKIRDGQDSLDIDNSGHLMKFSMHCGVVYRETVAGIAFEVEDKKLADKIQKLIYKHYNK